MKRYWKIIGLGCFLLGFCPLLLILSCSSHRQYALLPVITEEKDDTDIQKPKKQEVGLYRDGLENVVSRPIADFGNLSHHTRKLTNNLKQALNVNALGDVPNSTWFTNRHAKHPMTLAQLRRGPNHGTGPDTDGPIIITGAKVEGVSPGFVIKDLRGDTYFIKFDFKGHPQLNTAAEVITTKFVYACGYNTPENYISSLDTNRLQIAEGLTVKNRWQRNVPMTKAILRKVLAKTEANPDGTYRIIASKGLAGVNIGPFRYAGTRKDDPNDHIPHEYRRELRAYKVVAAWLNNVDSKASNTMDRYHDENGTHFVKHYILDFGTSLGAGGHGTASAVRGQRGAVDLGNLILKTLSLGLWVEPWEKKRGQNFSPSVGYFDSELFDPGDYAFIIPNPAFARATELDGFWGARLVMSFSDQDIRAIVETGLYHNKEDEAHVVKMLRERRDKTGRYWYSKVNPVDNFRISKQNHAKLCIEFDDLSVNAGFTDGSKITYRYRLKYSGKAQTAYWFSEGNTRLLLNNEEIDKALLGNNPVSEDDKIVILEIQRRKTTAGSWGKAVRVHFYHHTGHSIESQIIAIERDN